MSSLVLFVVFGILLLFVLLSLVIGISISNKLFTVCIFDEELLDDVAFSFPTSFQDKLNGSFYIINK